MRVSIFGLGYVGCVSAACLAREGHTLIGVDVNPLKVDLIGAGRSPVVEPGLDELIAAAVDAGQLSTTQQAHTAVQASDVSIICVGTPSNANGSLNTSYVASVCQEIGHALATLDRYHVVVVRSTVLPGTVGEQLIPLLEQASGKVAGSDFGVCMNPEFLREGSALADYYQPAHVIIGASDPQAGELVARLYAGVDAPVVQTTIAVAEMVKYADNAFHATKVAFANEIGAFCKAHGIDARAVMEIFCQDRRLNVSPAYLRPGFAFGGSCLPKDLRALLYRAKERDIECLLLASLLPSNLRQIQRGIALVEQSGCKRIGVLGLSFKAGTDDVRESPMVALIETLVGRGYQVRVYDQHVQPERLIGANKSFLERELPHIASLMCTDVAELAAHAEAVVIATNGSAAKQVAAELRDHHFVIDLVGGTAAETHAQRGVYEGICW